MKGKIVCFNDPYIVIKDVLGEYTVAETFGIDSSVSGSNVSGNLHSLGGASLKIESTGETLNVLIQDCHCSRQVAEQIISGR